MPLPLFVVDAFTDQPFGGNPAAVCLLDAEADVVWMQRVAAEMNLSETAFVVARGDGDHDLCWFTPTKEVDLCGHATLASAHILWQQGILATDASARFHTKSGVLTCTRNADGRISMDFPAAPATPSQMPTGGFEALGIPPTNVWEAGNGNLLVELAEESSVRAVQPDFPALLAASDRHGFIVTGPGAGVDYVCRYFVPAWGINEDPVTGSIQCTLATHWANRLGKTEFTAKQVSARGGELFVRLQGDRVIVSGDAVTVSRGELDA